MRDRKQDLRTIKHFRFCRVASHGRHVVKERNWYAKGKSIEKAKNTLVQGKILIFSKSKSFLFSQF